MYVHTYTCICVYVYVCRYVYVYMCICVYVYMYVLSTFEDLYAMLKVLYTCGTITETVQKWNVNKLH